MMIEETKVEDNNVCPPDAKPKLCEVQILIIYSKKNTMAIFKESEIKKMLDHVAQGNMSLSQFTQSLNVEAYKYQAHKGDLVTMMDVVRNLEAFLVHNENTKNTTKVKIQTLIDYMKSEVVDGALSHLT